MELLFKNESYSIIGAAMEVHRTLGKGFLESVYQESLGVEFKKRQIPFCREHLLELFYKGDKLSKYFVADFICFEKIVLELKSVSVLNSEHEAQVLNYLKATKMQLALLINFGASTLQYKRIVLSSLH
jgi:GxxExxY protein